MKACLLVRNAGLSWRFELESAEVRDELAACLGPWVQDAEGSPRPQLGGVISMTASDTPGSIGEPGDILPSAEAGRPARIEIGYRSGAAIAAALSALRRAAVGSVLARGGLALHASSVRTEGGILVFVGPEGAGKSTAANAFPPCARLDDDLVLLSREEGPHWVRLAHVEGTWGSAGDEGCPIRAVLLPAAGDSFRLTPLRGREAFVGCLRFPFLADHHRAANGFDSVMAAVADLCASVPVARMAWALGEDLPALLERSL